MSSCTIRYSSIGASFIFESCLPGKNVTISTSVTEDELKKSRQQGATSLAYKQVKRHLSLLGFLDLYMPSFLLSD